MQKLPDGKTVFEKFPPFIREFIYSRGWQELHPVQLAAADIIFGSDSNLLITSSTASGKTEAAFFPILSKLCEDPPKSVGVLYIAPLKSLINDQFERIDQLLDYTGIPVFRWHGDVAASHKNKLLEHPEGILQITPESLESMLIRRGADVIRLFGDLRYVIIDEIHTMTGTDRGNQVICQLSRLASMIGHSPRRIGLSATVGDVEAAARWLEGGSGRSTEAPMFPDGSLRWRLGLEHFFIGSPDFDQTDGENSSQLKGEAKKAVLDPGYEYMYDCVKDKRALVFSNSREETEYITATLRQIAKYRNEKDVFLIHHGNLSASLREYAESKLKEEEKSVVCATVTMELGIDVGPLERILHNDAPNSVSSFLQRLGRSGRRGSPPEMMMVFREEYPLPNAPLPQLIPWGLIRAIAVIQLYIEERFIEPPFFKKLPFSLAFQQTLSTLLCSGELTPKALAEKVLSLPPFSQMPKEDYRELIISMVENDYLEFTEEKTLIVGLKGEKLTNSFRFYAVFKDSEDFTVRCESDEIGTITTPPPVGDRFALAGRVWEVEELDIPRKLLYVKPVEGKMEISWPGDYGEIHTKILTRMRQVLSEDTEYPYLMENALHRLRVARALVKNTSLSERSLIPLGGYSYCLFPWLGTRSFRTLRKFIISNAARYKISDITFEGCYYIMMKIEGDAERVMRELAETAKKEGIDLDRLAAEGSSPIFEKYDEFIPDRLLRRAYAEDKLRSDEAEGFLEGFIR